METPVQRHYREWLAKGVTRPSHRTAVVTPTTSRTEDDGYHHQTPCPRLENDEEPPSILDDDDDEPPIMDDDDYDYFHEANPEAVSDNAEELMAEEEEASFGCLWWMGMFLVALALVTPFLYEPPPPIAPTPTRSFLLW